MADRNQSGTEKVYYYHRMKKIYIQKSCYDLDNNYIFPLSISPPNIWKVPKNDDFYDYLHINETEISGCDLSEILSSLFCSYWGKTEKRINTDYSTSRWILCIIQHICKYVLVNSYIII